MLRRATALKRICDRQRVQNAVATNSKLRYQFYVNYSTQNTFKIYRLLSIQHPLPLAVLPYHRSKSIILKIILGTPTITTVAKNREFNISAIFVTRSRKCLLLN